MKRLAPALALALVALLVLAAFAAAQTGSLATALDPLVVTLRQQVPVSLTLARSLGDGATVTTTVPVTVGIDLAITIAGDQVVSVTSAAPAAKPTVTVSKPAPAVKPAAGALVDNSGIPYTVEVDDMFELADLQTGVDVFDHLTMIGELRNTGSKDIYPNIVVTLYDADGKMLAVTAGVVTSGSLAAGRSAPFTTLITTPSDDVKIYRVQILAR